MIVLFQQFPIFIPFQHLHLLNGYLIEFDKTFSLCLSADRLRRYLQVHPC